MSAAADFVHIFCLYSSNWIELSFKIIGADILTNKICTLVFCTSRCPLEVLKFCTWKERAALFFVFFDSSNTFLDISAA